MARSYDIAILSQKVEQLEGSIKANDVIANPTGETTGDLHSIQVDGVKLNVPHTADDIAYDSNTSVKNKINSITDFSTTERVVGHWTDDKPIYEKTITIENFDLDGTSAFFPNVHFGQIVIANYFSNVDKMWCNYDGTILYVTAIENYRSVMLVDMQSPKLTIFSIPEYTGTTLTLTMRYTKTTDTVENRSTKKKSKKEE